MNANKSLGAILFEESPRELVDLLQILAFNKKGEEDGTTDGEEK